MPAPTYEKARVKYPAMPAADLAMEDAWAPVLKAAATEAHQHRKELATHTADPAQGKQTDAFCTELMAEGESADAGKFLRSKNNTIGELSQQRVKSSSRSCWPLAAGKATFAKWIGIPKE